MYLTVHLSYIILSYTYNVYGTHSTVQFTLYTTTILYTTVQCTVLHLLHNIRCTVSTPISGVTPRSRIHGTNPVIKKDLAITVFSLIWTNLTQNYFLSRPPGSHKLPPPPLPSPPLPPNIWIYVISKLQRLWEKSIFWSISLLLLFFIFFPKMKQYLGKRGG